MRVRPIVEAVLRTWITGEEFHEHRLARTRLPVDPKDARFLFYPLSDRRGIVLSYIQPKVLP
jgi:hypothetical protein